jgi:hypothetical protein
VVHVCGFASLLAPHRLFGLTTGPQESVITCQHCCKFVGTVWTQVSALAGNEDDDALPNALPDPPEGIEAFSQTLSDEYIQCDCGETYCSKVCQETAWSQHHWLLCEASSTPEEEADEINVMELFKSQALANNEILLLAGRVYARVLSTYKRNGGDLASAVRPYARFQSAPWFDVLAQDCETPKEIKKVRAVCVPLRE